MGPKGNSSPVEKERMSVFYTIVIFFSLISVFIHVFLVCVRTCVCSDVGCRLGRQQWYFTVVRSGENRRPTVRQKRGQRKQNADGNVRNAARKNKDAKPKVGSDKHRVMTNTQTPRHYHNETRSQIKEWVQKEQRKSPTKIVE